VVLLQHATRAADAQATPLSLETYPQLTDNAWLWALAERGSTAPAASGSAVPPVPSDFRCSLLLRSSEGGTNSSIAGPAFVAGSLAKVRMTGLYHVQLSGFENAQAANIILAPDRTTIIMDDPSLPAGAPPRCTLQRPSVLSTQMLAAATRQPRRRCWLRVRGDSADAPLLPQAGDNHQPRHSHLDVR
jgi:hypothetical protein